MKLKNTKLKEKLTFQIENGDLVQIDPNKITQPIFSVDGRSCISIKEDYLFLEIFDDSHGFDAFLSGLRIVNGWNYAGKKFDFIEYFRRLVDKARKQDEKGIAR